MNMQGQWYLPAYPAAPAAAQPAAAAANMMPMMSAAQAAQPIQPIPQASPYATVPQGYQQSAADPAKFLGVGLPNGHQLFAPPPHPQPQGQPPNQPFLGNPGSAAAAFYQAAGLAALSGLHPSALLAAASASSAAPASPMGQHTQAAAAAAAAAAAHAAANQQAGMRQLLGGGGVGGGGNGFSVFSKLPLLKTPAGSHHISPLKVRLLLE